MPTFKPDVDSKVDPYARGVEHIIVSEGISEYFVIIWTHFGNQMLRKLYDKKSLRKMVDCVLTSVIKVSYGYFFTGFYTAAIGNTQTRTPVMVFYNLESKKFTLFEQSQAKFDAVYDPPPSPKD